MAHVATATADSWASPSTVHALLIDSAAWAVWSPHVAGVDSPQRHLELGWVGDVRAFFSPVATQMRVTWLAPDRGLDWESTLGPWRLRYGNRIEPGAQDGSHLRWSADLDGPAADLLARIVGPLSRVGQQRRLARLARTAELIEAHAPSA